MAGSDRLRFAIGDLKMADSDLARALKGWLAGCLTATAVLFSVGLTRTLVSATGLTVGSLFAGLFLSIVHLTFICILTSVPAAIVIWFAKKFHIRSLVFLPLADQPWVGSVSIYSHRGETKCYGHSFSPDWLPV
jgi:hypothetical protein